ncbi:uncharacterized protein PHACADRAFT_133526 [Phanerochaete carnosa HHB-10118-sp]|uniref:Uncharacterized protein n=1 Tax=Phanerochaete carnosa (strain HHB-10118-sp) TaxID=650164 RepID=K5XCP3_PHACS|nr:uncharacterized protein PHACADRAFT_133526 [Phanerochaete carnosa HHB-10118-sp]EKM60767.1 hypothetical protein PHACADRAFT_133526 [Phanerochaete carnosa HHB-10118-sp]
MQPPPQFSGRSLYVPVCAAGFSLLVFATQLVIHRARKKSSHVPDGRAHDAERSVSSSLKNYVAGTGGPTAAVLNGLRVLSCLVLLCLSVYSATLSESPSWVALGFCTTYTYATILSLTSLAVPSWNAAASGHVTFVLLVTWIVYVYRDVWPLATYYLAPANDQDALFWATFAVLSVAAVIVPLTVPRKYVPYDPQDPTPNPNPEQTCSILSMMLFSFLDPVIWDGYRSSHLAVEQLPPLCDFERMKYMSKRSFPYLDPLDPQSSRHVFWGIMRLYS